jgi:hypothetical protein
MAFGRTYRRTLPSPPTPCPTVHAIMQRATQRPDVFRLPGRVPRYQFVPSVRLRTPEGVIATRAALIEALNPSAVLVQLVGSCDARRRKHLIQARNDWCGPGGFHCFIYLDAECKEELARALPATQPSTSHGLTLVAPSQYLQPSRTHRCCDPSIPSNDVYYAVKRMTGVHLWNGFGPSNFYCNPTRNKTLVHQGRFLPALAHGRREHLPRFRSGELKWLVQLDDDSAVAVKPLLRVRAHQPRLRTSPTAR